MKAFFGSLKEFYLNIKTPKRITNKMIKLIDKRNRRMTYGINKAITPQ